MNGCRFQEKSFSVAATDLRGKDFCEECGSMSIGTTATYKYNGRKMCKSCFDNAVPDKEIGAVIDNFTPYYDQQLGCRITSIRQKVRLLEKKGLHYSEDNPKFREKRKLAESYLGKRGDRRLDEKAKREFTDVTQEIARKQYERRRA